MKAVQQEVAAAEGDATSFDSSMLGTLQVKLSSSSHIYTFTIYIVDIVEWIVTTVAIVMRKETDWCLVFNG